MTRLVIVQPKDALQSPCGAMVLRTQAQAEFEAWVSWLWLQSPCGAIVLRHVAAQAQDPKRVWLQSPCGAMVLRPG